MTLAYRFHGPAHAPALVLSNSLGTTQELWDRQLPALAERFRVLTYDHPGHGTSSLPDERCTVEQFARDLLAVLDEVAVDRFSFCGASLGGMVGMTLALEPHERVERLVLTCTSAHLGSPQPWLERASAVRADGMEAIADAVVGRWFTPQFARTRPGTVTRFRAMLAATSTEGYARCCEALARWDARDRIRAIARPVLIVAADDDPAIPVAHAELLASRIVGSRLVVLEHAAHLANVERAEQFTEVVLEHLGQEVAV